MHTEAFISMHFEAFISMQSFVWTHRLMASRYESVVNASSSSTPACVVGAPSNAVLITFWNMTSRSLTEFLYAEKSSCQWVDLTSRMS
jgi:hypothetical protein